MHLDGIVGFVEHREFAFADRIRRGQGALVDRQPGDGVAVGRDVVPLLSVFQTDVEIVDAIRSADRAARKAVLSKNYANRTVLFNGVRRDVLTLRRRKLLLFRQRDPQLEDTQRIAFERSTVMPNAFACLHPLEAAFVHLAPLSRRVLVGHSALQDSG